MRSKLFFLLAIIALGSYFLRTPAAVPELSLPYVGAPSGEPDPCDGKRQCVTTFVAPWCSACHSSLPFIQALQSTLRSGDVGFKVIVGMDDEDANLKMAREIGGRVFVDNADEFRTAMSIRAVPTWIVSDGKGNVVKRRASGAPAVKHPDRAIQQEFLEYLGVES